jgi:hypothetical protein
VTPELFLHLLTCVRHEQRYGAQSTTVGPNMRNHILGVGYANFEQPVNSFGISRDWNAAQPVNFGTVKQAIDGAMAKHYGKSYASGDQLLQLLDQLWADESQLEAVYRKASGDCETFLQSINVIKAGKKRNK